MYKRVAVIGAGPSGLSALRALADEKVFDTVRLFERREMVGGIWYVHLQIEEEPRLINCHRIHDPEPDTFPSPVAKRPTTQRPPVDLPALTMPLGEDVGARTGIYNSLDSNVGAKVMAFTHTPFPEINSAASVTRYGANNPTRPWQVIADYLEDGFKNYRHLLSLNTTVEKAKKIGSEWVLTLCKSDEKDRGKQQDYWWQEKFDAIVVATGHYNVPFIPAI